jgi:hypothetical protein
MEWPIILVIVIAIPIILLPVAFVWYLNIAGIYSSMKEARKERAARESGGAEQQPVGAKR